VSFLDLGRAGRSSIWRYVAGFVTLGVVGLVLTIIPLMLVNELAFGLGITARSGLAALEGTGSKLVDFVALNAMFPLMLLGLFVVVRLYHGRSFLSVVTASRRVRWRRVGFGAAVWLGIGIVLLAVDLLQNPHLYMVTFEPGTWLLLAPLALLLTPIQTTAEELQCRGYLLQGAGRLTRRVWLAVLPSTIIFTLLHAANPEFLTNPSIGWVFYFVFGLVLALATVRDNGTELALGVHAANNLFSFLLVGLVGGVADVGAIVSRTEIDMTRSAIEAVVGAAAFWAIVFVLPGWLARRRAKAEQQDAPSETAEPAPPVAA
jgi:membrane protease YdiL (CAAX protease family)